MSRTKPVDPVAELKETLTHAKPQFKVVVMPDFYLDYILTYPGKLEDLTASFLTSWARRCCSIFSRASTCRM